MPAINAPGTLECLADEVIVNPVLLDEVRPWTADEMEACPCPPVIEVNGVPAVIL